MILNENTFTTKPTMERANGWHAVFLQVLSGAVVNGSSEKFAQYANQITWSICQVDSLFLPKDEIHDEPENLKMHWVAREFLQHKIPYIKFYYRSIDQEPHFTQSYGPECEPVSRNVNENTCAHFCLKCYGHINDVEWIKCPIWENWFHDHCFFVE